MTTPAPVHHARTELLALAAKSRPDLDFHEIARVVDDQRFAGLGWARMQSEVCRMLTSGGDLRDLRKALDAAVKIHGTSR